MEKHLLVKKLLHMLAEYYRQPLDSTGDYAQDRRFLRAVCNQSLNLQGINPKFYHLQDELFQAELAEKKIVNAAELPYKDNIAHWHGDITAVKADAIVNAANDQYLGCFVPCHNCIDNVIMSAAGFQMRDELHALKLQANYQQQKVKVTKGYNLPAKFVFHIAGPICHGKPTAKNVNDLANCYRYCLEQAKAMGLKNIVFCCLSTGEYGYQNQPACQIAVATVKEWLARNDHCLQVVFDTFKEIDRELYENELR